MKFYENYIELSDAHVIWQLNNPNLNEEESEFVWSDIINDCSKEFKRIYGCDFYMLGRSGRHVCVEDTPQNRQRWYRMKMTIDRLQKWMVAQFNNSEIEW